MRTTIVPWIAGILAAGCSMASRPPATERPIPSDPVVVPIATGAVATIATRPSCVEPTPATPTDRERGIDAFLADRPREALDVLTRAVAADPRDRAAEAFRAAAAAKLADAQDRAAEAIRAAPRVLLEAMPLAHTQRRAVDAPAAQKVRLERVSETRNAITDVADWEGRNGVAGLGQRRDHNLEDVPPKLDRERLQGSFVHPDHVAAIYGAMLGSTIAIVAPGRRVLVFDARRASSQAPRPLSVEFAQVVGEVLVVELAYNGYAKESGGKNGYVAAYDLASGALVWSSDPLVSNAREAAVSGGSIVVGYGFTAEPDFLSVLDLATGKVDQRIPLKSGPEAIRRKGDRLFVRTYDTDYVFRSTTGFAPSPPARLPAAAAEAAPEVEPEARCWVRRAAAAIAAKDAGAIHEARERLKPISRDRALDDLLRVEEENLGDHGRLDLAGAPLVVVPSPPWDAFSATPAGPGGSRAPKLVKVSSRAASPVRNMHPAYDPRRPWFIAPVMKGALPEGVRQDIPTSFGQEHLSAILPDERPTMTDRALLVYGGRYLALLRREAVERVFDLDGFRHPPRATPQWKEFATQGLTYAQERDGVLYLCNGGGSYAKEVFGKKGFLSAIQATTGKLLWRSAPLTCNATFAIAGDHIISGYGFTAEPDFVFVVRRADGAIVQRVPIDSGPDTITVAGDHAHVEAYGHVVDFELK